MSSRSLKTLLSFLNHDTVHFAKSQPSLCALRDGLNALKYIWMFKLYGLGTVGEDEQLLRDLTQKSCDIAKPFISKCIDNKNNLVCSYPLPIMETWRLGAAKYKNLCAIDISGFNMRSENREESISETNKFFHRSLDVVKAFRNLYPEELEAVSKSISHLFYVWRASYTEPPISVGIDVLRGHFARALGLPASSAYRAVLEKAVREGYFEGRKPNDIELTAFTHLMSYDIRFHDLKHRDDLKFDYSGLVNSTPAIS